jgi:hypothetical protein
MPDGAYLRRILTVDLDDGTTRKIQVDKSLWDSVIEGDSISKSVGSDPTKAERSAPTARRRTAAGTTGGHSEMIGDRAREPPPGILLTAIHPALDSLGAKCRRKRWHRTTPPRLETVLAAVGSTAVSETLEVIQPLVSLLGHVHESSGSKRG